MGIDPIVFGHRLRHFRQQHGWTLDDLGERIGRPAPFLSLVENGKREPKLSQISALADALSVDIAELLAPEAPSRRAGLEIELERAQTHPRYSRLGLPFLKPSAKLPDVAIQHILALFDELTDPDRVSDITELRAANAQLGLSISSADGHLQTIEASATHMVAESGYGGVGPLTTRNISDLLTFLGLTVKTVDDMPTAARAVVDRETNTIFVPQRNELRTRQARKAVLQTVGTIVLEHVEPRTADELLRQRLEAAYFAGAVLIPETAGARFLADAKHDRDLSVEDLKEHFYVSYEMAAQRFTNLATRHLGIRTHFARCDVEGVALKAYANDGVPFPESDSGGVEGQRLCRMWGARAVFSSVDKFAIHNQFTHTPAGSFWCSTHLAADDSHALTVGVRFEDARFFRGRTTDVQAHSDCPGGDCCRLAREDEAVAVYTRAQHRLLALLTPGLATPVEESALAEFIRAHRSG